MKSDIPLTPEQQVFAAEHHDLVFDFLQKNGLAQDTYYDVVIFGYLRAVRRYFTEPRLRQYQFSSIAWRCMRADLISHSRANQRVKRCQAPADLAFFEGEDEFDVLIAWRANSEELMAQMEAGLLLHDLARTVSRRQMDVVRMRSDGYGIRDIARRQNVTISEICALLNEAHRALRELCCV